MAKAKLVAGIDCDTPVHAGMQHVLKTRFEEMCAFREAVLDWSDPAGVHDMRVASRRLRGALQDFSPYLERRAFASSQKQIKHIARTLGLVRDQDVAIATLERIASKAPPRVATGIRRFADFRIAAREELRISILPVLDPDSLQHLGANFKQALLDITASSHQAEKTARQKAAAAAEITYREVATSIILERLKQLEKLSASLYHPLKKKPLHKMRIAAKHLRYALELFEQCWGEPISVFPPKVAALQSSLGKLHDCDVWIEDFGDAVTFQQLSEDCDPKATAVWLLTHFLKMRTKHLSEAMDQWHEWETNNLSERLRNALQ